MTSKIVVNNIEADSGVSTVTFNSNIQGNLIGNVTGNVNSTGVTTVTSLRIGTGASISSPATNVLTLGTNNSERVRVGAAGSVGIGTNDPSATLAIHDDAANPNSTPILYIQRPNNIAPGNPTNANADLRIKSHSSNRKIYVEDHNSSPLFLLKGDGTIGIGTTNSSSKLQVQGTIGLGASDDLESGFSGGRTKLTSSASGFVINHNDNSATIFQNQGTERVRIDSIGRVTTPYQVAFHAIKTVGDTLTTTAAKLSFGSATYDVGSNYSDANDRFTAPVAGKYFFYVSVNVLNTGNNVYISIRKNGGLYGQIFYAATNFPRMDFNPVGIIDLAAGDYVEIYGVVNTGTITLDNAGYFGGYLLG